MLQVVELTKSYGTQLLFKDVSFFINPGERVGVVGRNGHGKTTLFRLILGQEEPTAGEIKIPTDYRIGHLSQHLHFTSPTVLAEACLGLPQDEHGCPEQYKAEAILQGLGFGREDLQRSPMEFSGGFQIRLNLAKLLLSEPNLLLLDEPTNYLDIVSLRWLKRFLLDWRGELMLITHDRDFMDQVITHTIGIHRERTRKIAGATGKYYAQIEIDEEVHERTRVNQERKVAEAEAFIQRFRAKATKASVVQSRIKALDRMERLEALDEIKNLQLRFPAAPFPGKSMLEVSELSFAYQVGQDLFSGLSFRLGKHDRIAVIGKNGKGKTTLLRLLMEELNPTGGTLRYSPNVQAGYFGQTNVDRLNSSNSVEQEVLEVEPDHNRTRARGLCGQMMFSGDMALKKVSVLSGGERARVLLAKILAVPSNLLVLDEPANHLDMQSGEALIEALTQFEGSVILVTHSEELLNRVANRLIVFDRGGAFVYEGSYREFLDRVGWQDEQDSLRKLTGETGVNRQEARRARAAFITKRNKVLNPLRQRVAAIEEAIIEAEQLVKTETEQLIEVTKQGYGDDANKLYRSLSQNKGKIEELFDQLEIASKDLKSAQQKFSQEE